MKKDENSEKKKIFTFRLRGSFLSVLLLIQVLMIGLSIAFCYLMISHLKSAEELATQNLTKYIENEVRHRIYRSLLVTLNVAQDPETIEAFRKRDRAALLRVTAATWRQLQVHSITQFQFHIPTSEGIVSFLRVHKPDIYGEVVSTYRPLVVKCQLDKKLVSGLEQGKSGYGFRACAPVFYKEKMIGSVEIGSGFSEGFFKQLDKSYPGKWSLVNLERGIATIIEDKIILHSYNQTDEVSLQNAHLVSEEVLKLIKHGTSYHKIDSKTESVTMYVPIQDFGGDYVLYITHEYKTQYFAQIRKVIGISLLICLIGLMLSGAILLILYRQVTHPINELVKETGKIKSFNLDEKVNIRAALVEIKALVDAIANMKVGLQSFKKFVPSQLVRQLMESGLEANASGHRREVTVFFSDIADFTTISETMKPSELSSHLSEYFNELTNIIMEHQGTVDKYIGDAIMAFWNAPMEIKDHARVACLATLKISHKLKELEKKWTAQGKPAFRTRIGLNTGDVVVGNMGSDQRLNYTVIGDPVNLASRLEALNKYYGSKIIVSQFTHEKCADDFEVRTLDYVLVKGKIKAVSIYELLAEKGDISTQDREYILYYEEAIAFYLKREWDKTIEIFDRLLKQKPDDGPCRMFLTRCHEYKVNPPPESWTGEYAYEKK
jgi:class 3 adenylate cyclase/HAMP domain-containing protein